MLKINIGTNFHSCFKVFSMIEEEYRWRARGIGLERSVGR